MTAVQLTTVTGRIVQGNPKQPRTTDDDGHPLVYKSGANKGQPRTEYFVGLAIPKTDPGIQKLFEAMGQAAAAWQNNEHARADFSWKFIDGDDPKYADRIGHPGHFIFKFSSSYCPKTYVNVNGAFTEVPFTNLKRGDYAQIDCSFEQNGSKQSPGIYANLNAVLWVGEGEEIVSGPSAQERFGANAPALPPGAAAPSVQTFGTPPGASPAPQPAVAAPAAVPAAAPAPQPAAAPAPTPAPAPAPAPAPTPAPAAVPAAPAPGFIQPPVQ